MSATHAECSAWSGCDGLANVLVIDNTYRLDVAASAHARVESGRKKGSVVISVELP